MKMILKNFIYILQRFKTSSRFNLLGLSVAIVVALICGIQVKSDLSFNGQFEDADNIYQLHVKTQTAKGANLSTEQNVERMKDLVSRYPEIEQYTFADIEKGEVLAYRFDENSNRIRFDLIGNQVSPTFFEMFKPTILAGSLNGVETNTNSVVINKSEAERIFGTESAIDKQIQVQIPVVIETKNGTNTNLNLTDSLMFVNIVAVCADFDVNSSFYNGVYHVQNNFHSAISKNVFLKIDHDKVALLSDKLNEKAELDKLVGDKANNGEIYLSRQIELAPLKNINFILNSKVERGKDIKSVYSLIIIGFLTLAIAYINFINFNTAMAPARIKTLNIQRLFGANASGQRVIIASEAMLFTFIAFVIAIFIVVALNYEGVLSPFSANFNLSENVGFCLFVGSVLLVVGFVTGLYPAYYITSFKGSSALVSGSSASIRNMLTVIQFVAAIGLTSTAMFLKAQQTFMLNYSIGIEKENILLVKLKNKGERENRFKMHPKIFTDEVMKNPSVLDFTLSQHIPGKTGAANYGYTINSSNSTTGVVETEHFNYLAWLVSPNFISFFGLNIIDGENFKLEESGISEQLIVNEKFMNIHTLDSLSSSTIPVPTGNRILASGVVKDFNSRSLAFEVEPCLLWTSSEKYRPIGYVFFKIESQNTQQAISDIKRVWNQFTKEPFEIEFLDDSLANLYKEQENLANLVTAFSIIIILIAIMGVFGLVTFNSKYRAKEIAIRKVNGADEKGIIFMLNRGVLIQLVFAFIIAIPLAYSVVETWLQQFPYKVPIYWWIFALAGLLIFVVTALTVSIQSYVAATSNPVKSLKSE